MTGKGPDAPASAEVHRLERHANRMDLVARWADDLAHEIKNPLHAMVINLELVKRRAGSGEARPAIQRAEVVENELHRVHDLVDSLLRMVRPWPPDRMCDPDRIFEQLLPVLGARTRVRRVDYEHHPGAGVVALAPGDLAQVLLNLVDNAIEACAEGGRVVTTCEMGREAVTITVEDDGAGIPDDVVSAPDLRPPHPRPGRSGLGLAVSARLLRAAGGDLEFRSGAGGRGTMAVASIPRFGSA
ncbi:MAG TPA: HAMP domain-containing sensor histidine kinase [Longimicrobiales bacterium]|nr:HAMP domain-containing sensor histidine kinase [Longimicrobiales bacterium]